MKRLNKPERGVLAIAFLLFTLATAMPVMAVDNCVQTCNDPQFPPCGDVEGSVTYLGNRQCCGSDGRLKFCQLWEKRHHYLIENYDGRLICSSEISAIQPRRCEFLANCEDQGPCTPTEG